MKFHSQYTIFNILYTLVILLLSAFCFQPSAVFASESLYFIHSDHLGSTSVITKDGAVVDRTSYYPYGSERAVSQYTIYDIPYSKPNIPYTERGFTGQISDTNSTGLLYYNARYYNPTLAKFTTADSVPDQQNRYAYVGNNPINLSDPSGNMMADDLKGGGGGYPSEPGKGCQGLKCFEDAANDSTHEYSNSTSTSTPNPLIPTVYNTTFTPTSTQIVPTLQKTPNPNVSTPKPINKSLSGNWNMPASQNQKLILPLYCHSLFGGACDYWEHINR